MKDNITVEHRGIQIAYREEDNKFVFELRGRERAVDSLREAKEAIDKPAPKDKPAFERIECWYSSYHDVYHKVQVTSLVDGRYKECWIVDGKNRSKVYRSSVYPCNPHNDALAAKLIALEENIKQLEAEAHSAKDKLEPLEDSTNE